MAGEKYFDRYDGAGVKRFAFLLPKGVDIPPMMNQPSTARSLPRGRSQIKVKQ